MPSSSIEYQNILMSRNISYDILLHSNELIFTANIANCQDLYMHTSFSFIVEFHYEEWYIILAVVFFIQAMRYLYYKSSFLEISHGCANSLSPKA